MSKILLEKVKIFPANFVVFKLQTPQATLNVQGVEHGFKIIIGPEVGQILKKPFWQV